MELQPQQPQTSFIPKKPVVTTPVYSAAAPGLFMILGVIVFTASVVAAVGVFGYTLYLKHSISVAKESLAKARDAFDPASIDELVKLDSRMREARTLLHNHVAPSPILDLLERDTLSTVRYNRFEYTVTDGGVQLKLDGQTTDFGSLSQQSDQFKAESKILSSVAFSEINTDSTNGLVKFALSALVDPNYILYTANTAEPAEPVTATTAPNSVASTSGAVQQ